MQKVELASCPFKEGCNQLHKVRTSPNVDGIVGDVKVSWLEATSHIPLSIIRKSLLYTRLVY